MVTRDDQNQTEGFGEGERESERGKNMVKVVGGGGYRRDRPPEDDCCPICFDDFHIPCTTNCGHWFCGSCLLQLLRYTENSKQCTCLICGTWVSNLVPYSSALIQPGAEARDILKEIKRYNSESRETVHLPSFMTRELPIIFDKIQLVCLLLQIAYETYNFYFFPHGRLGIRLCVYAVLIFLAWRRWTAIRRDRRHLAE